MKPLHILTADATAGVLCHELARLGVKATWGPSPDPAAKYIAVPTAPVGPGQADRLTADDLLRCARNLHDSGAPSLLTSAFSIKLQAVSAAAPAAPRASTVPLRSARPAVSSGSPAPAGPVRVAIGVTCHAKYIPNLPDCLTALDRQTRPFDQKFLALDGCELSRQQDYDLRARGWQLHFGQWRSPNPGRQWALDTTDCEWIMFADADDVHDPAYIAGALTRIGDRKVGIVHADRDGSDGHRVATPEGMDYWGLRRHNYVDTSSLWRVHALREAGGWRDTTRWDDWDCAMRVTALGWHTARNPVSSRCTAHPDGSNRNATGHDVEHLWGRSFAVVSLLAGRGDCWLRWRQAAAGMTYPPGTHFYLCDNSHDPDFGIAVRGLALQLAREHPVTVIPLPDPYDNVDWLSRHRHVAHLYNRILPRVTEDMVLFWEDDVIPPEPAALRRLAEHMNPDLVGGICALYETRDGPGRACASMNRDVWGNGPTMADARGHIIADCGFLPGGFAVYNNALVQAALPFAICFPRPGHLQGWDGQMGLTVRAAGFRLDLDGTVECQHLWQSSA